MATSVGTNSRCARKTLDFLPSFLIPSLVSYSFFLSLYNIALSEGMVQRTELSIYFETTVPYFDFQLSLL